MKRLLIIAFLSNFYIVACSDKPKKAKIKEVILVETPDTRALINFWKDFSRKFNSLDTAAIRKNVLDSIWLWRDKISSTDFIKRYVGGYSRSDFLGILDTNNTSYSSIGCYPSPLIKEAIKQKYEKAFSCKEVTIINDTIGSTVEAIQFIFLETTKGYRLFGIERRDYPLGFYDSFTDTTTILK